MISTLKKLNSEYQTILRHHEHFIALRTRIIRFPDFCTLLLYSTESAKPVLTRGISEKRSDLFGCCQHAILGGDRILNSVLNLATTTIIIMMIMRYPTLESTWL